MATPPPPGSGPGTERTIVALIIAFLLLALILGGLGFAVHVLWILAVIALVIWLIGFLVAGANHRWYHW